LVLGENLPSAFTQKGGGGEFSQTLRNDCRRRGGQHQTKRCVCTYRVTNPKQKGMGDDGWPRLIRKREGERNSGGEKKRHQIDREEGKKKKTWRS